MQRQVEEEEEEEEVEGEVEEEQQHKSAAITLRWIDTQPQMWITGDVYLWSNHKLARMFNNFLEEVLKESGDVESSIWSWVGGV